METFLYCMFVCYVQPDRVGATFAVLLVDLSGDFLGTFKIDIGDNDMDTFGDEATTCYATNATTSTGHKADLAGKFCFRWQQAQFVEFQWPVLNIVRFFFVERGELTQSSRAAHHRDGPVVECLADLRHK